jgi:glutathionyl-hydroquinone reductase
MAVMFSVAVYHELIRTMLLFTLSVCVYVCTPAQTITVSMQHIKAHYYTSHAKLNAYSIIPAGPNAIADFSKPHDRDRFTK